MVRSAKPPSETWRTFLDNHVSQLASVDFLLERSESDGAMEQGG
jgi:hypothetical protein